MNVDYYGNVTVTLAIEQWIALFGLFSVAVLALYIALTYKGGLVKWIKDYL